jgi:hypothetical protein
MISEHKRKANDNRLLDADIQRRETTVTARGKVRGLGVSIITYWNMPRSDDDKATTPTYYYGEGKGININMEDSNDTATVPEYGIGNSLGQKTGSAFYRTSPLIKW